MLVNLSANVEEEKIVNSYVVLTKEYICTKHSQHVFIQVIFTLGLALRLESLILLDSFYPHLQQGINLVLKTNIKHDIF